METWCCAKCALVPAPLRVVNVPGCADNMRGFRCTHADMEKYERDSCHSASSGFHGIRLVDARMHDVQSYPSADAKTNMGRDSLVSAFVVWLDTFLKSRIAARGFERRPLQRPSDIHILNEIPTIVLNAGIRWLAQPAGRPAMRILHFCCGFTVVH